MITPVSRLWDYLGNCSRTATKNERVDLSSVVETLRNPEKDWVATDQALKRIPILGKEAIPALPDVAGAMTHENEFVRYSAVKTFEFLSRKVLTSNRLDKFGPLVDQALPALVGRFQDEEPVVRTTAALCFADLADNAITRKAASTVSRVETHLPDLYKGTSDPVEWVSDLFSRSMARVQRSRMAVVRDDFERTGDLRAPPLAYSAERALLVLRGPYAIQRVGQDGVQFLPPVFRRPDCNVVGP